MKNRFMTVLLTATMIVSMTACGNTTSDTTDTMETTMESSETITVNEDKGTQDNQVATLPLTDEEKPAVTDTKEDPKTSADPKAPETPTATPKPTESPKSAVAPKATESPKATGTQTASVTATTKPTVTEKPKSTTAPVATPAPKATEAPKTTPAPTAAPVACQHTNTHVESSHDTYQVPISGGCVQEWRTATRVCNDCGANLGEAPDRVGDIHHGCIITEGISATCTTDGRTAVCGCDCGGLGTTGGEVIPAFGHDYVNEWDHDETDAEGKDHVYFHSICRNCGDISSVWEE